jgi:hypothetical protein
MLQSTALLAYSLILKQKQYTALYTACNEPDYSYVLISPQISLSKHVLIMLLNLHQKNDPLFRRMVSSGLLRHVALVRTDVSEEPGASFIRVTKIGELGTTQAATSNRCTLRRNGARFLRNVGSYKSHMA